MKSIPKILRGPFRNALKFALEEASFVVTLCVLFEVGNCGDVDDRRTRRVGNDIQVRAARAEALVQVVSCRQQGRLWRVPHWQL